MSGVEASAGNCYLFAITTLTGVINTIDNQMFSKYVHHHLRDAKVKVNDHLLHWGEEKWGVTFYADVIFHIFHAEPW